MPNRLRCGAPAWARAGAAALLAAAAALASAEGGAEPFRGDAELRLGDRAHAAFPERPPGPHRYVFFATAGTVVSASVTADRGASLAPVLRLARPGGERIDTGRSQRAGRSGPAIGNFRVPFAGLFVLEVVPARGDGGYTLSTRGGRGRRLSGLVPGAEAGGGSYEFHAPGGARVSVRVSPRGRGPRIVVTGVTPPCGGVIPVLSIQRGAAAEIRNVVAPEDGRYRVTWENRGAAGDLALSFRFDGPGSARRTLELGTSDGLAATVVERGDPVLAPREGYVGSAACGRCHDDVLREWSRTAHNSAVRAWNRAGLGGLTMANDIDGDGTDDFREGLDLATTPAFAAYGANAPTLSFVPEDPAPCKVRIGAVTYDVDRTMGGNGLWTQSFLTRIGTAYHVLPFEFDEAARTYRSYDADDWYDASRAPRLARAEDAPRERSFEARCSGCHNTGETLEADAASGRFVTGYVELNVGCEQCHGPGAEHAVQGDTRKIRNPRDLLDDTREGVAAANAVCARCHTKGDSADALPGVSARAGFGFRRDRGVAQFGDAVGDFLSATRDPADFWGLKSNPLPGLPGDTSLAARGHPLQGPDIDAGAHAPRSGASAACFDCHDPHSRRNPHQVAAAVDRGVRVSARADDNSLCLACHAGREGDPFAAVPVGEVASIGGGAPSAAVARAAIDHMRDVGMPVRDGLYDPRGTGVGRCTTCHMPRTPEIGAPSSDKGGFSEGGLASHRFEIVWPNASVRHGVTNSCNRCHPTEALDAVGPILAQWANPAAGSSAFHGAEPPASQDGIALNGAANPSHDGGVRCVECHTSEGFVRIGVAGEVLTQSDVDAIARTSVARDRGITCDACHGRRGDGRFWGTERNPIRLPREELCARCHNDASVVFEDFRDQGAVVRHPQREMLAGTAGAAPPGAPEVATTSHSFLPDGCVACHFDTSQGTASHDFRPSPATCAACHRGLTTFNRPAAGDYDGDGAARGIQDEVTGLLALLRTALLADPRVTFAAGRFDFDGAADHALTGATEAQMRAVFNWYSVEDDRSRGVHNAARAVQLLQRSHRELTGADVPGAVLR